MPSHHLTQDLLLSTLRQAALQVTHHHPASLGPQCGIPSSPVGGGGGKGGEGCMDAAWMQATDVTTMGLLHCPVAAVKKATATQNSL